MVPSSSPEPSVTPSVTIKFSVNNTFVVRDPLFAVNDSQVGFLKLLSLFTCFKLNICVYINLTFWSQVGKRLFCFYAYSACAPIFFFLLLPSSLHALETHVILYVTKALNPLEYVTKALNLLELVAALRVFYGKS